MVSIGIRKEDKNRWEARAPLTPEQVNELVSKGIDVYVETSDIRAFSDEDYRDAGATITDDLSSVPVVFGVKEMPSRYFVEGGTYIFFSHTIKGQKENMPMLQTLLDRDCNLIDYERIVDDKGRRLVFFGHYAGYAGMVDSLWALGKKLEHMGHSTAFGDVKKTIEYDGMEGVRQGMKELGEKIKNDGLPKEIKPLTIGFTGYGNVSQTAQELLDMLPHKEVSPKDIFDLDPEPDIIYKVVFKEEHMVEPNEPGRTFDLQEYYKHPERYHPVFSRYLPYLTVMVNCVYWEKRYPRLVTKERLSHLHNTDQDKLLVIGDITCDVEGAVECNTHVTTPGDPVYTYDPHHDKTEPGVQGEGPVILAVDHLPCELPRESTHEFGELLKEFIPYIAEADYTLRIEELNIPDEIKRAMVVYRGKLTPSYKYIQEYLEGGN